MEKKKTIFSVFWIVLFLLSINFLPNDGNNIISTNQKEVDNQEYNFLKDQTGVSETEKKKEKNASDIIGNIKISGTRIQQQIVQGVDNEFYLNHSVYKEPNIHGSVFMDYRNTLDDRKLLIYGHNSQSLDNALFHDLEKYLKKDFYKDNQYIYLTLNNEETKWQIFSIMIVEENDNNHMKITFNDYEWIKHIDWMTKKSIYDTNVGIETHDRIITLQTCYYKPRNSYLIVNAKKIK